MQERRENRRKLPPMDIPLEEIPNAVAEWNEIAKDPETYAVEQLDFNNLSSAEEFAVSVASLRPEDEASTYLSAFIFVSKKIKELGLNLQVNPNQVLLFEKVLEAGMDKEWKNPLFQEAYQIAGIKPTTDTFDVLIGAMGVKSKHLTVALRISLMQTTDPLKSSFLTGATSAWGLYSLAHAGIFEEGSSFNNQEDTTQSE